MRVQLKTLGCRLNEAELETWAREFQADGHRIVAEDEPADLVVFNSCAVTGEAVRKSRQLLRRTVRENPGARLVLSGCYATLNRAEAESLGVDLVVANADKAHLVEIVRCELDLPAMPALATEPGEVALFRLGRQRAFVKVQDGCRYRCTYCIVTVARGAERSRSIGEIVSEINGLHEQGIQEAVLTGVHLGGYGDDTGTDLVGLIRAVLADTAIPRLRLGSLEPWDLPESFVELYADPRFLPHLHLPLQSGSDSVLKRMARRCKSGEFATLAAHLRRVVPDFQLTTDVIVGFPGETEVEWAESLAFIDRMEFGHIHIFSFSPRAGTPAAEWPDQVSGEVKRVRSQVLHKLAERQKRETLRHYLGRDFPVLWENTVTGTEGNRKIFGYTPNYLRVGMVLREGMNLENQITEARMRAVAEDGEYLVGQETLRR